MFNPRNQHLIFAIELKNEETAAEKEFLWIIAESN